MPLTKSEVYHRLIARGVDEGYYVVPEYRIWQSLEHSTRDADLVWCVAGPNNRPWLPVAVFEIEGHDVERRKQEKKNGIEKDADTILSAARFVLRQSGIDAMPAAAVVLFQLAPDGRVHNSRMKSANVAGHRQRFAAHAAELFYLHQGELPTAAGGLGAQNVVLDNDLDDQLDQIVATAHDLAILLTSGTRLSRVS